MAIPLKQMPKMGRVPRKQSMVLAFDNDVNARQYQDVGLTVYVPKMSSNFLRTKIMWNQIKNTTLSPSVIEDMSKDPFSPINDPAGDNFHHYRGSDYDAEEKSILDRYKRFQPREILQPRNNY